MFDSYCENEKHHINRNINKIYYLICIGVDNFYTYFHSDRKELNKKKEIIYKDIKSQLDKYFIDDISDIIHNYVYSK